MDERLKKIIDNSDNIVFFGGAGVSTESNIPDFRSEQGLYNAKQQFGLSPEEMLSHSFFMRHMKTFFEYYRKNLIYPAQQGPLGACQAGRAGKTEGDRNPEYRWPASESRQQNCV